MIDTLPQIPEMETLFKTAATSSQRGGGEERGPGSAEQLGTSMRNFTALYILINNNKYYGHIKNAVQPAKLF